MSRRRRWYPYPLDAAAAHVDPAHAHRIEAHWRLHFIAFGRQRGDGHARFKRGELARLLGVNPTKVTRIIAAAAERGLCRVESTAACVVLPSGFGHKYDDDAEHGWCPHHRARAAALTPPVGKKAHPLTPPRGRDVSELTPDAGKFQRSDLRKRMGPSSSINQAPVETLERPALGLGRGGRALA